MLKKYFSIFIFIWSLCNLSFAVRPFFVDDPAIITASARLELSYGELKFCDCSGYYTGVGFDLLLVPQTMQMGIDKDFFHSPAFSWANGDSTVSLKYNLVNDSALKVSIKTTDGDEVNGFGNEFTELGCHFLQTFSLENNLLYTNLSYNFYNNVNDHPEDIQNHWHLGLGLRVPVITDLDVCAELSRIFVSTRYVDADDSAVDGMVGLRWVIDSVPFDISYRFIPTQKTSMLSGGVYFSF